MPIGQYSILELLLRQLRHAGIRQVIISVNHLAGLIQAVVGDGSRFGMQISYQMEDEPLGTCGALAYMLDRLPEDFLVVNGDLLTNFPIRELLRLHGGSDAVATVATVRKSISVDFGVIVRDESEQVIDYVEKPTSVKELSIGLYAVRRAALQDFLQPGRHCGMPDVLRHYLSQGQQVRAMPAECIWIDIGRPEQYLQAQDLFETTPQTFLPPEPKVD